MQSARAPPGIPWAPGCGGQRRQRGGEARRFLGSGGGERGAAPGGHASAAAAAQPGSAQSEPPPLPSKSGPPRLLRREGGKKERGKKKIGLYAAGESGKSWMAAGLGRQPSRLPSSLGHERCSPGTAWSPRHLRPAQRSPPGSEGIRPVFGSAKWIHLFRELSLAAAVAGKPPRWRSSLST